MTNLKSLTYFDAWEEDSYIMLLIKQICKLTNLRHLNIYTSPDEENTLTEACKKI